MVGRVYVLLIPFFSLIAQGCLHYEAGVGEYNYQSREGSIKGTTTSSKVGVQNVMGKGKIAFGVGVIGTTYSKMQTSDETFEKVQTHATYGSFSLGIPFGNRERHSLFAEYETSYEHFNLKLFEDYSRPSTVTEPDTKVIHSNKFSLGYRFSTFWAQKRRFGSRSSRGGNWSGNCCGNINGKGAALIVGVALVVIIAEVIAQQAAKHSGVGRQHSFSWHLKYNYKHTVFPEDALLYNMDPNRNEMFERSMTAGMVIDWI